MTVTTISLLLLVLDSVLLNHGILANGEVVQVTFNLCRKGYVFNGNPKSVVASKSVSQCAIACLTSADCGAFNFCPDDAISAMTCQLLVGRDQPSCTDVSLASAVSCRHGYQNTGTSTISTQGSYSSWSAQTTSEAAEAVTTISFTTQTNAETTADWAETTTTTESITTEPGTSTCLNGGTLAYSRAASVPLSGPATTANATLGDCTEAYEHGTVDPALNGIYWIQPVGASEAFQVVCDFEWGGVTYPFRRSTMSFDKSYLDCKAGFGDPLDNGGDPSNLFVGLANLHYLLNQASYDNNVYMSWYNMVNEAEILFKNFSIGDDSTNYFLSYSEVDSTSANGAEVGLVPGKFSASGRDFNRCASANSAPGWYDGSCSGPSRLFGGVYPGWMIGGDMITIDWYDWNIYRTSAYY